MISYKQGDVVYRGGGKQQAIHSVEDPAVSREEVAEVLHVQDTLEGGLEEVAALGEERDAGPDDRSLGRVEVEELVSDKPDDEHGCEQSAHATLDRFVRAEARVEQVSTEKASGKIGAGVGDPGSHDGYEDEDDAVWRAREEAEVGERGADPEGHQEHGQDRPEGACLRPPCEPEHGPGEGQQGADENPRRAVGDGEQDRDDARPQSSEERQRVEGLGELVGRADRHEEDDEEDSPLPQSDGAEREGREDERGGGPPPEHGGVL